MLWPGRHGGLFRRLVDTVSWEAALKGRAVQEGWMFFKKEIKSAGAGCPRELRDELAEKRISLAEQRNLAGTQGKNESL